MSWRLVYWNGEVFSSEDGEPEESPDDLVLICVQPGNAREIETNAAWCMYRKDFGEWTFCGEDGLADHARKWGHLISAFRKTVWIRTADFNEIWKRERRLLGYEN